MDRFISVRNVKTLTSLPRTRPASCLLRGRNFPPKGVGHATSISRSERVRAHPHPHRIGQRRLASRVCPTPRRGGQIVSALCLRAGGHRIVPAMCPRAGGRRIVPAVQGGHALRTVVPRREIPQAALWTLSGVLSLTLY
jgi:hypothetical protein